MAFSKERLHHLRLGAFVGEWYWRQANKPARPFYVSSPAANKTKSVNGVSHVMLRPDSLRQPDPILDPLPP